MGGKSGEVHHIVLEVMCGWECFVISFHLHFPTMRKQAKNISFAVSLYNLSGHMSLSSQNHQTPLKDLPKSPNISNGQASEHERG